MAVKSSGAKAPKPPDGTALWVKLNRGVWWPGFVLCNAATFFEEEHEVLIPLKHDNHRIWEEDSHRVKTSLGKLSVKDRKMYRLHLDRIRSLRSKQNADPMEILTSMEPSLADPSSTLDKRPNVALPTETAGADCNISPEKENADLPPETSVVSYILHTKDDVGPETTVSDSRMMPAKKKPRGDNVVLQTEKIMGLKDNELKLLCNHLGHTVKVHETHYRSTSGLIERLEIAKLMLIREKNIVGKFAGQSLNEIRFEDIMENENDQNEVPPEVSPDQDPAIGGINDIDLLQDDGYDSFNRLKKKGNYNI